MDPLTIISGIAGVATAGSALANALYNIISSIRDAPREMVDVADSIRELSTVLRELRRATNQGKKLFKTRLFKAIHSATRRVREVHEDVLDLLDGGEGGLAKIVWAFRRSKAAKLLTRIEAHKSTVQLMATTMLLSLAARDPTRAANHDDSGSDEDHRRELRMEAENLVQVTKQKIQCLLPETGTVDHGTQTEDISASPDITPEHLLPGSQQLQKYDSSAKETAKWLHRLVFGDDSASEKGEPDHPLDLALVSSMTAAHSQALDSLLVQWTDLSQEEIQATYDAGAETGRFGGRLDDCLGRLLLERREPSQDTSHVSPPGPPSDDPGPVPPKRQVRVAFTRDENEEPIVSALGSVYNAGTLGRWLCRSTFHRHGSKSPDSAVANDMRLLLQELMGKMKRVETAMLMISEPERQLVRDYYQRGRYLVLELQRLLRLCEAPVRRAVKAGKVQPGFGAAVEFAERLFGRDHGLKQTLEFMDLVREWCGGFDTNCGEIPRAFFS